MYLALNVALAEQRRRQCPCGAVAERHVGLCRKCQSRNAWRRKTTVSRRKTHRRRLNRYARNIARFFGAIFLLAIVDQEMEG